MSVPSVAVCISTFHRPEGLTRVLESMRAQALPEPAPAISVVVVNNDPDDPRPAEICAEAAAQSALSITCLAEAKRGLAPPAQSALDHVRDGHDFLAYIDDDSIAEPEWLARLLEVHDRTGADVVTGPVHPDYETPPEPWLEHGGFFAPESHPTRAPRKIAFTNNVLIATAILRTTGVRFDDRFGLIGGEDVHFFRRLHQAGATITWADDAIVMDSVPTERATARWLIRRHERTGMTTALIERDLRPAALVYPLIAAKAAVWFVIGAAGFVAGVAAGRAMRVRARCRLAWGRGLIAGLLGRSREEYRLER